MLLQRKVRRRAGAKRWIYGLFLATAGAVSLGIVLWWQNTISPYREQDRALDGMGATEAATEPGLPEWMARLANVKCRDRVVIVAIGISDGAPRRVTDVSEYLKTLPFLRELDVCGRSNDDDDMKLVAELRQLQGLHLVDTSVTDRGIEHITALRQLRKLSVSSLVTEQGLKRISHQFPELEYLSAVESPISDNGIEYIAELTSLRYLGLKRRTIDAKSMTHLTCLSHLESMRLEEAVITERAVERFGEMMKLKELVLSKSVISNEALKRLRKSLPKCKITVMRR